MIKLIAILALMALGPAIAQGLFCLRADIQSRKITPNTLLVTVTVILMLYAVYIIYSTIEVV